MRQVNIPRGFSLVELLVVIALIGILAASVMIYTRPDEVQAKARDNRRLADAIMLMEAFEAFRADFRSYPDVADVERASNVLPGGNANLARADSGWIDENLSAYLEFLPVDPINDNEYYYRYMRSGVDYELNIKMEFFVEKMTEDGGNSGEWLELGTDKTLLD